MLFKVTISDGSGKGGGRWEGRPGVQAARRMVRAGARACVALTPRPPPPAQIIPLGALAASYTRQDGITLTGDTGEKPRLPASMPPHAMSRAACCRLSFVAAARTASRARTASCAHDAQADRARRGDAARTHAECEVGPVYTAGRV